MMHLEVEPLRLRHLIEAIKRRIDALLQIAIVALSLPAMILITGQGIVAHWGWWLGLASQPFWLAATWRKKQWGMFMIAIFYTGMWSRGIVNHF